jgi:hypothetical protein
VSGAPNWSQIRELREALAEVSKETETIARAEEILDTQRFAISCASERLQKQRAKVCELMKAMDCEPNGNMGSENRMLALLTGLLSEAVRDARSKP